jgi:hypothetical protein
MCKLHRIACGLGVSQSSTPYHWLHSVAAAFNEQHPSSDSSTKVILQHLSRCCHAPLSCRNITTPPETHEARLARENAALVVEGRTRQGTQQQSPPSEAPTSSAGGWTDEQLKAMAQHKEKLWNAMILRGKRGRKAARVHDSD